MHDEVSQVQLEENIGRWNAAPLDGYVVLGSNGEGPLLDDAERTYVIRTARRATPAGRTLIVGAGRQTTRGAIRAVREAFDLGADGVLVGVPDYFRPAMNDEVLRDHYLRVADAAPGPVLLYSVPYFTGLPIGSSLFGELLRHERVAGIKDSSGDVGSLSAMLQAARSRRDEVSVLVGNATVLAEGLALGAVGCVLAVACVAPKECAEIAGLVSAGRIEQARAANRRLDPLSEAVTRRHGIGGLKAALDRLGFHGGDPRPPLPPATPAAREEIAGLISALGLAGRG